MAEPCESESHATSGHHHGDGHVLVKKRSPCGCKFDSPNLVICKGGWDWARDGGITCSQCRWHGRREDFWKVIRFLEQEPPLAV